MELYQELQAKTIQLEKSIKLLRQNGTAYAEAERDYKILLRQECLKLRDEGMAIGMINMTAYGISQIQKGCGRSGLSCQSGSHQFNKASVAVDRKPASERMGAGKWLKNQ